MVTRDVNTNRTYRAFQNMRARCKGKYKVHTNYAQRGITCDPEWFASYDKFLDDMGACPEGLTLDREDNDKGYSKENCRWVDYPTQLNNRSNSIRLTHNGETRPLSEWSSLWGTTYGALYDRVVRNGWTVERALSQPMIRRPRPSLLNS